MSHAPLVVSLKYDSGDVERWVGQCPSCGVHVGQQYEDNDDIDEVRTSLWKFLNSVVPRCT